MRYIEKNHLFFEVRSLAFLMRIPKSNYCLPVHL